MDRAWRAILVTIPAQSHIKMLTLVLPIPLTLALLPPRSPTKSVLVCCPAILLMTGMAAEASLHEEILLVICRLVHRLPWESQENPSGQIGGRAVEATGKY